MEGTILFVATEYESQHKSVPVLSLDKKKKVGVREGIGQSKPPPNQI